MVRICITVVINSIIDKYSITKVKEMTERSGINTKIKRSADFHPHHVSDGKSGKWKQYLSEEQIKVIESQANDFLKYFHYI